MLAGLNKSRWDGGQRRKASTKREQHIPRLQIQKELEESKEVSDSLEDQLRDMDYLILKIK